MIFAMPVNRRIQRVTVIAPVFVLVHADALVLVNAPVLAFAAAVLVTVLAIVLTLNCLKKIFMV